MLPTSPQMNPQKSGFYSPSLKMAFAKTVGAQESQFISVLSSIMSWGVGVKLVWEGKAEMLNMWEGKLLFTPFCKLRSESLSCSAFSNIVSNNYWMGLECWPVGQQVFISAFWKKTKTQYSKQSWVKKNCSFFKINHNYNFQYAHISTFNVCS